MMYNPQLETFLRVADAGSFNKAAEELYITPPAVIKQITSLEAGLDLLADFVPSQLLQGHTVVIPRLGRFRLTFKSKGAAEVNDFSPTEMIYDVRAVFTPDADFRQRIKQGITFEDGGVMKDDISYKTRLDYLKAIGEIPDDGTEDEGEQGIPNP